MADATDAVPIWRQVAAEDWAQLPNDVGATVDWLLADPRVNSIDVQQLHGAPTVFKVQYRIVSAVGSVERL